MEYNENDIAVIGYSLRFPKADNADEFWENLQKGMDCISHTSDTNTNNAIVRSYGRIEGIYDFDADFFDVSEHDAAFMDPQQRWLITLCYEAMENSGHKISENNKIGLFAGTGDFYYVWRDIFSSGIKPEDAKAMKAAFLEGSFTLKASYILGLTGPSFIVKNACASGLGAVHMAVRSLINGECDIALAGGVSINENQEGYQNAAGTLSDSGTVRPFDNFADGFVPGNGGGIIVLRRMGDSISDRDYIHSVIKGTAVCNDGKQKSGYSAPSIDGEARAITEAVKNSGLKYNDISYIETHGTATDLGDVIEIEALRKTYCSDMEKRTVPLYIGSVKSNVGHLNYAAGVAGLIKASLMLENKKFVPTIYYQQENPKLRMKENDIYVNRFCRDWNAPVRAAGVSSFGIGGADAHIVMTEYIARNIKENNYRSYYTIPISAKSEKSLKAYGNQLKSFLEKKYSDNENNTRISDIAFTLAKGRESYPYRAVIAASNFKELINILSDPLLPIKARDKYNSGIIFMFGGSNSYKRSEVYSLLKSNSKLEEYFGNFSEEVLKIAGISMKDILSEDKYDELFEYMLPFSMQYAIAKYYMYLGIEPDAVMGYSAGEFISAVFAGVLKLNEAIKLCIERFKLFAKASPGKMISVMADEEKVITLMNDETEISAYNCRGRVMVSGTEKGIDLLKENLDHEKIIYIQLPLKRAGHCFLVDNILKEYDECLKSIEFSEPDIMFYSSLGREAENEELMSADYWISQMRSAVKFKQQCEAVQADFEAERMNITAVEIGFGEQLSVFFNKNVKKSVGRAFSAVTDKCDDRRQGFALGVGSLWAFGLLRSLPDENYESAKRIPLPRYQFDYHEFNSVERSRDASAMLPQSIYIANGTCEENYNLLKYLLKEHSKVTDIEPIPFKVSMSELKERFKEIESKHFADGFKCMGEIDGLYEIYDEICLSVSAEYFRHYGLFVTEKQIMTFDEIVDKTRLINDYIHLVKLMLGFLQKFEYISYHKGKYTALKSIESVISVDECVNERSKQFPEFIYLMELVHQCCTSYPDVLEGKKLGKEVLYPEGRYDYVTEVYKKTPSYGKAESYSAVYADMLREIALKKKGKLRILELGAGSGIVSWKALKALEGCSYEYWFTDIGNTFLYQARKRIEAEKIKDTVVKRVDITKRFYEQDIPESYFDIVVSCGVIQSVADMGKAIDNMKYALKPGGVINFLQPVGTHHIREFFGGLTPEWWNYKSDPLRSREYNISSNQWRCLLREHGFPMQFVLEGDEAHITDSVIITGQLDGNVRAERVKTVKEMSDTAEFIYVDTFTDEAFDQICSKCEQKGIKLICGDNLKRCEDKIARDKGTQTDKGYSDTDKKVLNLLESILGAKIQSIDDSIYDYDVDSLTALMFVSCLNERFGIHINPRELFYCTTIGKISELIEGKMQN